MGLLLGVSEVRTDDDDMWELDLLAVAFAIG